MKTVIKRHASDLQVFRALAVAQAAAAADPSGEIFVECLERWRRIVELAPAIKWKNPHHPYEVAARAAVKDSGGKTIAGRPGGKLYDQVIDLEPDNPLEIEFLNAGLPWWQFISAKLKAQNDIGAKLALRAFPEIADPACPYSEPPANFVVLAPLSRFSNPRLLNANTLEAYAKKLFPDAAIFWISEENTFLGEGRTLLRWDGFISLAWILKAATAVFSVNGLVSALAQSTVNGQRLVRRYCHIRGRFDKGFDRDVFLKFCSLMETETDRGPAEPACSIAFVAPDRSIQTEKPFPRD